MKRKHHSLNKFSNVKGGRSSKLSKHYFKNTDDFNPYNITEGMDEIDILMDELEKDIPEDAYIHEEFDVEKMLQSNKEIKEKIQEISVIVTAAITKAAILKKTVVTHRDISDNTDVKDKLKILKKHQSDINKCK